MKKRFSKISIHSLGFRIFVLLAVMIVLFCALVVYNNTAAFGLMLERIHENSENTLVLYQKSLDENLSRPETYLYVFALNDTDLLSLRAAEPQTTSWYTTLNRIKKSFENAAPNYTVDGFFCYQEATDALVLYDQTSNPPPLLWNYIRGIANTEAPSSVWNLNEINGKYYLVRILNLNGYLLGAYISTDTLLGTLVDTKTQDSLLYFSDGSLLLRTPSNDVRLEAPRLKWRRYPSYEIDGTSWMAVSHELKETPLSLTLLLKDSEYTKYQTNFYIIAFIVSLGLFVVWLLTGVWHGANWTYIVWGLLNYGLLMWEKYGGLGKGWPKFWGWLYTFTAFVLTCVVFRSDSLAAAGRYFQVLFHLGGGIAGFSGQFFLYLREYALFIVAAALCAAPIGTWLRGKVGSLRSGALLPAWDALSGVCLMAIFLLSVCFIVKGTYNPFIYFNF